MGFLWWIILQRLSYIKMVTMLYFIIRELSCLPEGYMSCRCSLSICRFNNSMVHRVVLNNLHRYGLAKLRCIRHINIVVIAIGDACLFANWWYGLQYGFSSVKSSANIESPASFRGYLKMWLPPAVTLQLSFCVSPKF